MRRRVLILATALCLVMMVVVVLGAKGPGRNVSSDVLIEFEDPLKGSIYVTNRGKATLAATIWFQVYSNRAWHPPKEELFKLPSFVLVGAGTVHPKGIRNGDSGRWIRYQFTEPLFQDAPWRVVVLCQKYYAPTVMGQIQYALARYVTQRASFSNTDHRGPYDEWIYSETITRTQGVSLEQSRENNGF